MAKKSMIYRDVKRLKTVVKFKEKRLKLKAIIKNVNSSDEEKFDALVKLQALPKNASPVRLRNRCHLTGRPHGFYRKFGLSRNMLREKMMNAEVPGLSKSSW